MKLLHFRKKSSTSTTLSKLTGEIENSVLTEKAMAQLYTLQIVCRVTEVLKNHYFWLSKNRFAERLVSTDRKKPQFLTKKMYIYKIKNNLISSSKPWLSSFTKLQSNSQHQQLRTIT